MRRASARGFSLLELVVAVAILAAVLGLAVPSLLAQKPSQAHRRATLDLVSNLRWARSVAVGGLSLDQATDGVDRVDVTFDPAAESYTITIIPPSTPPVVVRTVNLASYNTGGTRLDLVSAAPVSIQFERNGAASAVATLVLDETTTGRTQRILVTRAGLARTE